VLPDYEEVAGKSLVINQTDDGVSLTAPLSDFFRTGEPFPIKREVQSWLDKTIDSSLTFTSDIKVMIEAPEVGIGVDARGKQVTSVELCMRRLEALERVVRKNPQIRDGMCEIAFRRQKPVPGRSVGNWEDQATVQVLFSNTRRDNR
jgi:hypothetical protein